MKSFEIGYKAYYHEVKEWSTEVIRAQDRRAALRVFARKRKLDLSVSPARWRWWDGEWLMVFAYAKPVAR